MRKLSLALLALTLFGCDTTAPLDGSVPGEDAPGRDAPRVDAPVDAPRPDAGPLVLGDHPRILLGDRATVRARLTAALGSASGTRFAAMVDNELASGGTYAFRQSDAALLGVLTGEARYCTHAVAETEAFVVSEEALIASGERPQVAFDSYLEVGDRIGDLAMVYDWCFDMGHAGAANALDRLREPGGVERVEPRGGGVEWRASAVVRLVGREPPRTTTTTRSSRRR
jgi:hypothetical protein